MGEGSGVTGGYLGGQLLVAMPAMRDPRFVRSVIYMLAHDEEAAMGLVINRVIDSIGFSQLLVQLDIAIQTRPGIEPPAVHFGGPVDTRRGFVLHSPDYHQAGTQRIDDAVALTATIDILRAIAEGGGPRQRILALGYAGWGPGQLDAEIQENAWLSVAADPALIFDTDAAGKWDRALAKLGVHPSLLSTQAGRA